VGRNTKETFYLRTTINKKRIWKRLTILEVIEKLKEMGEI